MKKSATKYFVNVFIGDSQYCSNHEFESLESAKEYVRETLLSLELLDQDFTSVRNDLALIVGASQTGHICPIYFVITEKADLTM